MIYAWENPKCGQNSFLRSVPYTGPHSHAEAFSPENLLVQQTGGLGFRAERCAVPPYHTPGGTSSATDLLSVKELDCLFKMVSLSRNKGMTVDSKKKKNQHWLHTQWLTICPQQGCELFPSFPADSPPNLSFHTDLRAPFRKKKNKNLKAFSPDFSKSDVKTQWPFLNVGLS